MKLAHARHPLFALLALLIVASMVLAACGAPATEPPAPAATEAPATEPPAPVATEAPATEPPAPAATEAPVAEETGLSDSFDNNDNGWQIPEDEGGSIQIQDGQMVIKVEKADSWQWTFPQATISDVDLSFDVVIKESTPSNVAFGVVCRHADENNYYDFVISNGNYQLAKMVNGTSEALADWAESTAIKTGIGETNRIRVVCAGSSLEFYANDQLLLEKQDTSLTEGDFGLEAGRYAEDDAPVSVTFDNLEAKVPTPTEIMLSDSFDNNDNNWNVIGENSKGGCFQIEESLLSMKIEGTASGCAIQPQIASSDVDVSYDFLMMEGAPNNSMSGVICRYSDDKNFYELLINNNGYYGIVKAVNGKVELLVDFTPSDAIIPGIGEINHIRAVCSGSSLELYANDQLLVSTQDESLTAGSFALHTYRQEGDETLLLALDNLEVKVP